MSEESRHISRAHRLLALAMVCVFAGGHLVLGQAVAWAIMLVERSQTMTVAEAMDSTFSGDAPCARCCQVRKAAEETHLPMSSESSGEKRNRGGMVMVEALPPVAEEVPAPGVLGDVMKNFRDACGGEFWLMDRSIEMPPWLRYS